MKIFDKITNSFLFILGVCWIVSAGFYLIYSRVSVLQSAVQNNESVTMTGFQRDVDILFDFKYDKMKNEYEDMLQTAAVNDGLRVELANNGINGMLGIITPGKARDTVQVIHLNHLPTPGIWHTIAIQVRNGKLELWLDGFMHEQCVLDNPNFLIDDVAVGTGFSRERPFNGEIKNFKLKTYKYSQGMTRFLFCLLQSGVILLISMFFRYKKITTLQNFKDWIITGKSISSLLIDAGGGIFLFGMVIISTMKQIGPTDWEFSLPELWPLYYEGIAMTILFVYGLWRKAELSYFGVAAFLAGIFVFLKRYYIFMSCLGAGADMLSLFAFVGMGEVAYGFFSKKWCKTLFAGLLSFVAGSFFSLLQIGLYYSFYVLHKPNARYINGDDLQALFATNIFESSEFISTMFSPAQVTVSFIFILIVSLAFYKCFSSGNWQIWRTEGCHKLVPMGILCVAAGVTIPAAGVSQSLGRPILESIYSYRSNINQMDYYRQLRKTDTSFFASKSEKGETYVLIIGESGNKKHCSAYGYLRDTTPWMNSLRTEDNTIFFENAYASYVHTVPSILNILTEANQYNGESNFSAPSLIEVAKKAGFKTYWFSNQTRFGLVDNPLAVISEEADEVFYTANAGIDVDEKILDIIDAKLRDISPDENNLIIIHLMGSHEKYFERLPRDFPTDFLEKGREFLGDSGLDNEFVLSDLNLYDATIKYTDENLQKLYSLLSGRVPNLSAFIYMPDHGEDVYGKKRHMASMFTFEMARIPFMIKFSDAWKAKNAERFQILKKNSAMPFTTDCFFESFCGIAGIKSSAIHDATLDIGRSDYSLNWDNAICMKTNKDLQTQFYAQSQAVHLRDDPEYIMRKNVAFLNRERPNTFLAIACDSVGSAYEAVANGFEGLEINVTVQKDGIFMGHGPEMVLPMTLDEYLSRIPLDKMHRLWLDTKLQDPSLIPEWYNYMAALDEKYHLKDKVILETSLADEHVKIFPANGWETNFYLLTRLVDVGMPCPKSIDKLSENNSGEKRVWAPAPEEQLQIEEYANRIATVINRQQATNISFWAESYPFIQQEVFPRLHRNIGYCSWAEPNFPLLDDPKFIEKFSSIDSDTIHDEKTNAYLVVPRNETYHISYALRSS